MVLIRKEEAVVDERLSSERRRIAMIISVG